MELPIDSRQRVAEGSVTPRRNFSISSQVVPGLMAALDSTVILSVAGISYLLLVADHAPESGSYPAAVSFVWLTTILLMNFAGLYDFEPIMRPLAFADKIVVAFATTLLFLLAAAFSLKISTDFSRLWIGCFAISACTATIALRVVASQLLRRLGDMQVFTRNVVVVGAGEQAEKLVSHIQETQPRFVSLLGLFADRPFELNGHVQPISDTRAGRGYLLICEVQSGRRRHHRLAVVGRRRDHDDHEQAARTAGERLSGRRPGWVSAAVPTTAGPFRRVAGSSRSWVGLWPAGASSVRPLWTMASDWF